MRLLKQNLLIQFSVISFVIILTLGVIISSVLSIRLNRNIELLEMHDAAMDSMMHAAGEGHVMGHNETADAHLVDSNHGGHSTENESTMGAAMEEEVTPHSPSTTSVINDAESFSIPSLKRNIITLQILTVSLVGGGFIILYFSLVSDEIRQLAQ